MKKNISISGILRDIRNVYASDPAGGGEAVRAYVEETLAGVAPQEKADILKAVRSGLSLDRQAPGSGTEVLGEFVRLLLGSRATQAEALSPETVSRLAGSLNTVFDSLNEIIRVMNATLGGGVGEETIRAVIGGEMGPDESGMTLQDYLGQIRKAFLVSHKAFQDAAKVMVRNILAELDPRRIESGLGSGLKFGALKKADAFEAYEGAYQKVKKWFESPRFAEDLLREFEKGTQKTYTHGEVKS